LRPPTIELDVDATKESAVHGRVIFLLATPGSGAERLRRALGALPGARAATVPTHIFIQGVDRILDHWRLENGPQALSGLADVQPVLLATRLLADAPYAAFLAQSGAQRVVEYSEDHIMVADEVAGLYPDACLVHVVRDGRQVAARLSSAVYKWSPRDAARRWMQDQRIMRGLEHPNVHVVRVEDLVARPGGVLRSLAPALGFDVDAEQIERAAAEIGAGPALPTIATGRAGATVEIVAPDLLIHYGYDAGTSSRHQLAAAWSDLIASGGVRIGRQIGAGIRSRLAPGTVKQAGPLDT
jgi:hypothetical protein